MRCHPALCSSEPLYQMKRRAYKGPIALLFAAKFPAQAVFTAHAGSWFKHFARGAIIGSAYLGFHPRCLRPAHLWPDGGAIHNLRPPCFGQGTNEAVVREVGRGCGTC